MKKIRFTRTTILLCVGTTLPLTAQNLSGIDASGEVRPLVLEDLSGADSSRFSATRPSPAGYALPGQEKAAARLPDGGGVYVAQDSLTLGQRTSASRSIESVVDLGVLREPSLYRKEYVSFGSMDTDSMARQLQTGLALVSAVYRPQGQPDQADCDAVSLSVGQRIRMDGAKLLEIVESEISANPACACEIVKTAIKASEADIATVANIVETAVTAAPETMRIVSQCAIAQMPESLPAVQEVLARLEPNAGDGHSAKSAKSAKASEKAAAATKPEPPNPLDLPPPWPPIIPPPPIVPPPVTDTDSYEGTD